MLDYETWVERVSERGGFTRSEDAERAIAATLAALAERIDSSLADAIRRHVTPSIASALQATAESSAFGFDELAGRVARREGTNIGFAREHAQVVGNVLATAVGPDVEGRLRAELGESFARELLDAEQPPVCVPDHHPWEDSSLSGGRQGSRHPLSEAKPGRPQTHSVASEENPHGDTKLSSARPPPR